MYFLVFGSKFKIFQQIAGCIDFETAIFM